MSTKMTKPKSLSEYIERETVTDEDIEQFLKDNHDEVAAMLQEAEDSIARGDVAPLEPLPVLLREEFFDELLQRHAAHSRLLSQLVRHVDSNYHDQT